MKRLVISLSCLLLLFLTTFANDKIDSLQRLLERYPSLDSVRVDMLNELGYQYWITDPLQSEIYGTKALQLADTLKYLKGEAFANRVVGVSHWARANYPAALQFLFDGLKIYQKIEDSLGVATIFNNIGLVYADQRSYDLAVEYYEQSLKMYQMLKKEGNETPVLNNLGNAYVQLGNYAKAEVLFHETLARNQTLGRTYGVASSYSNLGELNLARKRYTEALDFFQRSIAIRETIPDFEGTAMCLYLMGKTYLARAEYGLAEQHLLQGVEVALKVSTRKWLTDIYEALKDLEEAKGNYQQALVYFEQFSARKDSLFDEEKSRQIAEMETRFQTLQKEQTLQMQEKQLQIYQQQARLQALIRNGLLLGLLVLLVMGYLVVSRQRLKIRKNKELLEKSRQIHASEQALAVAALENVRLKEKELRQELDYKNKELTSYTINFIQKNELMEELKAGIEQLKKSQDREVAHKLNGLNRLVENSLHIDRDWEDFKRHFEEVHKDFFKTLKEQCAELTNNELKLCALLKLNMNLKEAASMLGISPESVKTARYRLRKKLNLSRDENLVDHIIHLESGLAKSNNE